MGTRTRQARGPRETPHCGADRARRWGWRRTRSEPTRPAVIGPAARAVDPRPPSSQGRRSRFFGQAPAFGIGTATAPRRGARLCVDRGFLPSRCRRRPNRPASPPVSPMGCSCPPSALRPRPIAAGLPPPRRSSAAGKPHAGRRRRSGLPGAHGGPERRSPALPTGRPPPCRPTSPKNTATHSKR